MVLERCSLQTVGLGLKDVVYMLCSECSGLFPISIVSSSIV